MTPYREYLTEARDRRVEIGSELKKETHHHIWLLDASWILPTLQLTVFLPSAVAASPENLMEPSRTTDESRVLVIYTGALRGSNTLSREVRPC
jgi:hypothetical protein